MSTAGRRGGEFVPDDHSTIRFVDSSSEESEEGDGGTRCEVNESVETSSAHSCTDNSDSSDSGINTTDNASGTGTIGDAAERPFPIHNLASAQDDDVEFEGQLRCVLASENS